MVALGKAEHFNLSDQNPIDGSRRSFFNLHMKPDRALGLGSRGLE